MELSPALPAPQSGERRLPWLVAGLAAVWLSCEAASLAGFSQSPAQLAFVNLIILPHFPIAFAGMIVFYLAVGPRRGELLCLSAAAVGLAGAFKVLDLFSGWQTPVANCACVGVGLASLAVLAHRALTSEGPARRQAAAALSTACLILASMPLIFFFLLLTVQLQPTTLDGLAYAADGTLGTQPSFLVARLFAAAPGLAMLSGVVYLTLPVAFMVLVALHLRTWGPPVFELLPTFLAVAVVGFAVYNVFPVVGPFAAFTDAYPHAPPAVEAVLADSFRLPADHQDDPRNGMPSLHTAWALVIFWQARPLGRLARFVAGFYLAFTLLATVGYGAHYAFDLIVAFPSTLACQALCLLAPAAAQGSRRRVLALSATLAAGWLLLLRFGLPVLAVSPVLTAGAALATVVGCLWAEHRLHRAALVGVAPAG